MPRHLPWKNKTGGSKGQVKDTPRPIKRSRVDLNDDDDDFFEGTVLGRSRPEKAQTDGADELEDDLPDPSNVPATFSKSKQKDQGQYGRELSSSPPPIADQPPPEIEFMENGISRFDLRDDEWMMVEDELLQTAKLFTRHLHLAEYEKLKETIQQKKEDVLRPTIINAKPSGEALIKARANAQLKAQKNALRDILDGGDSGSSNRPLHPSTKRSDFGRSLNTSASIASAHSQSRTPAKAVAKPLIGEDTRGTPETSDSEDLDAPRNRRKLPQHSTNSFAKPTIPSRKETNIASSDQRTSLDDFRDRRTPLKMTPTPMRSHRKTPFDLLDEDFVSQSSSPSKPNRASSIRASPSIEKPSRSSSSLSSLPRPSPRASSTRPIDLLSEHDYPPRNNGSKEHVERLAKRKADQEKEKKLAERKAVKLNDIPTFLF